MPQVWKRRWGKGRVFYSALGMWHPTGCAGSEGDIP